MTIISFELVSLLVSIAVIMNLKLTQKFLLRILKGTKIYLPITDKDYDKFNEIKREKSAQFKPDGVVRICELDEYITVKPVKEYLDVDTVLFFFLASVMNLLMIEGKNFSFNLFQYDIPKGEGNEDNGHNFNIASSFSFITITYTGYILYKYTFDKGYKSYDAKLFFLVFICSFFFFLGIEVYFPEVLNINYETICETVNTRMSKLIIKAEPEMATSELKFTNEKNLKIFFASLFSLFLSLFLKSSERISYFDSILISKTVDDTQSNTNASDDFNKVLGRVQCVTKSKQILNLLLLFLLVDPLLKNILIYDMQIITELTFTLGIILPIVVLIFFLEVYTVRYSSMLFLLQNYYEMLKFYEKPNKEELPYLRIKMNYLNAKFWEVFLQIFAMFYLPFVIFFFYVTRCNLFDAAILNHAEFKPKTGLTDSIAYIQLLAILIAKSLLANVRTFFNQMNRREKSALII